MMKWALGSFCVLVIGSCVALALLAGFALEIFGQGFVSSRVQAGQPGAAAPAGDPDAAANAVVAMHARNRNERDQILGRIRQEFGVQVTPGRFSSHHTAGDYLERLRLARQAEALGLDVDPDAFGDDEFMRRHIAALRPGAAPEFRGAAGLASDRARPRSARPVELRRGDYIFVYGHRYYADGRGAYVRDDGTVLDAVGPKTPAPRKAEPEANPASRVPAWDVDTYRDLDALLEMLLPQAARESR